jgi:hypothetical protein
MNEEKIKLVKRINIISDWLELPSVSKDKYIANKFREEFFNYMIEEQRALKILKISDNIFYSLNLKYKKQDSEANGDFIKLFELKRRRRQEVYSLLEINENERKELTKNQYVSSL